MMAMSGSAAERFFSLLAIAAATGAIVIVVAQFSASGRIQLAQIGPYSRWLAFAVAGTAMTGSLYFSEVRDFTPCKLCWLQRIAMFSAAIVLLVGAIRRDRDVRWYVVPLATIGICISIYHYVIEWFPQLEAASCEITVPCTAIWFREFGFVTLSFMAMCGFAAVLALLLLTSEENHGEQAVPPVDVEG